MKHVCLVLDSIDAACDALDRDAQYESTYKVLGSMLYSTPYIKMSLAINGNTLSFLHDKHPEFLCLLQELIARAQVELIGGGYYDPVFPLLLSKERTAQIDMLTSAITKETGKRPHTAIPYASSWDDCLVSSFKTNGIDCVLLDSSIIGKDNLCGLPIVMSDRGKAIDILPMQEYSAKDTLNTKDMLEDAVLVIYYSVQKMAEALKDGSFLHNIEEAKNQDGTVLSTITEARARVKGRKRAYIASAISRSASSGASNIHELLQAHPSSDDLYHRQMLVSILIEQYHGDKVRKKTARDYLLCSQCGGYLFGTYDDAPSYKMLNEAERQIQAASETVTAFDTNEDGRDEYVCRMAFHTSVIEEGSGSVASFDAMAGRNLYRYSNCLFDDYFESAAYDNDGGKEGGNTGGNAGGGAERERDDSLAIGRGTHCTSYRLLKLLRARREVFFWGEDEIGESKISVKKKYIITSNGFVVQYIIKNEGGEAFSSRFCVRFCFSHVDEEVKAAALRGSNVSAVRLMNKEEGISFLLEPNEDAAFGVCKSSLKSLSQDVTLSWKMNIAGGMECEKTISFAMLIKDDDGRSKGAALQTAEKTDALSSSKGQLSLWDEE